MSRAMSVLKAHAEVDESKAMNEDYARDLADTIDEEVERLCEIEKGDSEEEELPEEAARELAALMLGHHNLAAGL